MKRTLTQILGLTDLVAGLTADQRLTKIQNAKRALMKADGLGDIEPVEDGLWEGDLMLNEEQIDRIIKNVGKITDLASPLDIIGNLGKAPLSLFNSSPGKSPTSLWNTAGLGKLGRHKRNGMLFDQLPNYKWPNGLIPFYISPDFSKKFSKSNMKFFEIEKFFSR